MALISKNKFYKKPATPFSLANRSLVQGVGTNDADYMTGIVVDGKHYKCPIYRTWIHLIERIHSKNLTAEQLSVYEGCTMCEEWLVFSVFAEWYDPRYIENWEIDKDFIFKGNKHYSPETCIVIPQSLNSTIIRKKKSKYGRGINKDPRRTNSKNPYRARMHKHGKYITIGSYSSAQEATANYYIAKGEYVCELSVLHNLDPRTKNIVDLRGKEFIDRGNSMLQGLINE